MKPRQVTATLITLGLFLGTAVFVRAVMASEAYQSLRRSAFDAWGIDLSTILMWSTFAIVAVIGVALVVGARAGRIIAEFGLNRPVVPACVFALVASLPMLIGYAVMSGGSISIGSSLIVAALIAPFIEELFFRGWAFRQLCQRAKWGFWPAALFTGLVFGLMHVPFRTLLEMNLGMDDLSTVLITGAGGVFFAWLFMAWGWNLWVPILLHAMMNGWWAIFAIAEGAVGGMEASILRGLTIAAAVLLTIFRKRIPGLRAGQVD